MAKQLTQSMLSNAKGGYWSSTKAAKAFMPKLSKATPTHAYGRKISIKSAIQSGFGRVSKVPSYKKGGTVKKTGLALVHKGETVVPKKMTKEQKDKRKKSTLSNAAQKMMNRGASQWSK